MSDFPNQDEPGLDRHAWASEWESLQEDLEDRPAETLPALVDIVAEMLRGEGYAIDDPVASECEDFTGIRAGARSPSEGEDVFRDN